MEVNNQDGLMLRIANTVVEADGNIEKANGLL
jgi:hypothetical protein